MGKNAIDYNVFGGPQNFGKWMDVHSAPSCPVEVIKDVYFCFLKKKILFLYTSMVVLVYLFLCT